MQIEVKKADILTLEADGLLLPICIEGIPDAGLAGRAKPKLGQAVLDHVSAHVPIAVGAGLLSDAGSLPAKHVIHSPVAESFPCRVGVEVIRRTIRAGLLVATHYELNSVLIPGFGYGENGVPHDEAARALVDEVKAYKKLARPFPTRVILVDEDEEMLAAMDEVA